MFDKSKDTQQSLNDAAKSVDEAAQEITKAAQTVESVKDHFRRNKKRYLIGGGVIVGTTVVGGGGILIGMRLAPSIVTEVTQAASSSVGDVSDSSTVMIDQSVNLYQQFGGYACKILKDAHRPELMWPKIQTFCEQMAEEHDVDPEQVRRMLQRYWAGKVPNVYGYHPQKYGVTTTS